MKLITFSALCSEVGTTITNDSRAFNPSFATLCAFNEYKIQFNSIPRMMARFIIQRRQKNQTNKQTASIKFTQSQQT